MPEGTKITEVTVDGEEEPIVLDMQSDEDQLNTVSIPLQNSKPVSIAIPIPIPFGGFAKDLSEDYSEEFSSNTLAVMMTERKATQVVTDHFKSSPEEMNSDFKIDSAA